MTTTILLIRHGETESNALGMQGWHMGWSEEDLNATGFRQAESVALRLAKAPISAVYSSSSKRAMNTSEIIGRYHGLRPVAVPALREINYGDWEGKKRGDMREKYPEIHRQLQTNPMTVTIPGGESFKQVTDRVI
jgi:broad specificity phosphatase PhoE